MSRFIAKTFGMLVLLLLVPALAGRSSAEAGGYLVSCGFTDEVVCEPGGSADCVSVT